MEIFGLISAVLVGIAAAILKERSFKKRLKSIKKSREKMKLLNYQLSVINLSQKSELNRDEQLQKYLDRMATKKFVESYQPRNLSPIDDSYSYIVSMSSKRPRKNSVRGTYSEFFNEKPKDCQYA